MVLTREQCVFSIRQLLKTSRPGHHKSTITFNAFEDPDVCIVRHVQLYLELTRTLRTEHTDKRLLSYMKPHKPITRDTVARWMKRALNDSGVNIEVFGSPPTRSASTSALAAETVTFILNRVGWRRAVTFAR